MSMFFRVIDFETSGEQPDGEVIEVGWATLTQRGSVATTDYLLIRLTRPVSVETTAIHHLRQVDLRGGFSRDEAFAALSHVPDEAHDLLGERHFAYAAHSAKFEQSWWPDRPADIPWVCTYKCALRLWPDAPRHSNQVLRYYLGLDLPAELAMPPHRAAPDAYVTAHILKRMLQEAEPAQLIQWSSEPVLLPKVNFGKHFGTPWTEVDYGYHRRVANQDFDVDVLHTRHEMARPGGGMSVACAIVGDSIALAARARCVVVAKIGIGIRAFADLYANRLAAGLTVISLGANDGTAAAPDAQPAGKDRQHLSGSCRRILPQRIGDVGIRRPAQAADRICSPRSDAAGTWAISSRACPATSAGRSQRS